MNKRIRELAQQCWKERPEGQLHFDNEKFAQLIVVECMDVFGRELPEPGDGRMTEVIDRICNVAEHFGVDNGR
jgi:hypothetical protein